MLRSGAARSLSHSLMRQTISRGNIINTGSKLQLNAQYRTLSSRTTKQLQLALYRPAQTAIRRYATALPSDEISRERTDSHKHLKPHPEAVSEGSSTRHVFTEEGVSNEEKETDMMAGVKADIKTIKETFSLDEVPKEALYIGMAGVLPYLATSLSTVYLAWDINHAAHTGTGFLLDGKTAEMLLHIIEPLQVGYGAVIISFLGAIHWGLEWAGYGGNQGYSRYRIGMLAPAIAWPTILMPVEYALITQFLAFNYLYFVDAKAAAKGWAPEWYGMYRFVLTFVVGAAIVVSLVGRGQIVEYVGHPHNAMAKVKELRDHRAEYLAQEEALKEKSMAEENEE